MRLMTRLANLFDSGGRDEPALGGTVTTLSGPIHYLADGPKGAPPFVLLHGASGNLRDWTTSIQPRLARTHPTIALDRPGFGHSRPVRGPVWRLDAQVRALREVVRSLGHERYFLVGHSYSGALALDWAIRHPDEVAGVALLGGVAMDWGGALSSHYQLTSIPVLGRVVSRLAPIIATDRWIGANLAEIFAPQPVPPGYRERAGVDLALRPATFRINARAMHDLHAQVVANEPKYGQILVPVEVLHGAEDTIVPAHIHAEPLCRLLPNAVLTLLPDIGHMPHHAATDDVLTVLKRLGERAGAGRSRADNLSPG